MKKKTLALTLAIIAIVAALGWWFTRPASPSGKSSISHNGLDISITYSRPYKKGRVIFGEASTGALQTYGQYWRLGANAATEITFNKDVTFGGQPVNAGTYRMYAVPGAGSWQIVLNSALGKSGSEAPDPALDVLKVEIPANVTSDVQEQFVIDLKPTGAGVLMELKWDRVSVAVEIS
ncbi:DUF2911 domain-containing protein [Chryseolinea sp. T2]|uniref:DUF2911 domain-containing protein n=1 Tax=Chryseolinea sp. T2 TaxID=3129255 RepID=UPI003078A3C8